MITDAEKLNSVLLGLTLISVLHKLYPDEFEMDKVMGLLGNAEAMKKLKAGQSPAEVLQRRQLGNAGISGKAPEGFDL